jgi:putative membrane protein insertion efficiency factor
MPAESLSPEAFARPGLGQRLLLRAIRGYQLLFAPMYAGSCRYLPSCSAYAIEAIERHGAARGGALAVRRLMRCHPFGGHGLDPVPASRPHSH